MTILTITSAKKIRFSVRRKMSSATADDKQENNRESQRGQDAVKAVPCSFAVAGHVRMPVTGDRR